MSVCKFHDHVHRKSQRIHRKTIRTNKPFSKVSGHSEIVIVTQSCSTLCDPMDCSLPGPSVHGILQVRILEWIAISFSRGLPDPGIKVGSPALKADSLPTEPPEKPKIMSIFFFNDGRTSLVV